MTAAERSLPFGRMSSPRIGIVAPSSPVGHQELQRGVERLKRAGFDNVRVHRQALARHFVSAGTNDERANALLDFAFDDGIDVIWCARGGYGAAKVVALLAEATKTRGLPKPKLLVGYSDITILHEFVRNAWGWRTLHAPMITAGPGTTESMWKAVDAIVRGERPSLPYEQPGTLRWISGAPSEVIEADVIGGNLSLWASMAGTPWQANARDRILFLEDIDEKVYRLDRMVVQLEQAGMLDGAAAIVLGDFTDCNDESPTVAGPTPDAPRVPLRPTWGLDDALLEIFGRVTERLRIPLARNLPVGHGPGFWPLRLGVRHALTPDGVLVAR